MDKFLDTKGVTEHFPLGKSTLDKLRCSGGGPPYSKVGARILYRASDVEAWIDGHRRGNTGERRPIASPSDTGAS